jgi:hypothetical protein
LPQGVHALPLERLSAPMGTESVARTDEAVHEAVQLDRAVNAGGVDHGHVAFGVGVEQPLPVPLEAGSPLADLEVDPLGMAGTAVRAQRTYRPADGAT